MFASPSSDLNPEGRVTVPEGESASSEEPEYIQLNAKELHSEIARLEQENQDFSRLFNTRVGDRAARKYQPIIKQKEEEIEDLKMQLKRLEFGNLDVKDIEKRFAQDPEFAKEYAAAVHYKPRSQQPVDETPIITNAINEAFSSARELGLDEATELRIRTQAANGEFTQEGEHWTSSFARMQTAIARELLNKTPAPKTNPNLRGGPSLTPPSRKNGSAALNVPKTAAEFNSLPQSVKEEILNDPEGLEAVRALSRKG